MFLQSLPLRKLSLAGTAIMILLCGLFLLLYLFYFPRLAHQRTLETLAAYGFDTSQFNAPQSKPGALLYKDILLDADGISTINMLKIDYSAPGLLFQKRLKNMDFYSLDMTGEQNGTFSADISGLHRFNPETIINYLPLKSLQFKNASLSLLTQDYGGLTFDFDWQGRRKDKSVEFQARVKSVQRYLSLTANATGIASPAFFNSDVEIEQGKFDIPELALKVTRVNGWVNIAKPPNGKFKITSELRAGGVNFLGMPWQNASATIEAEDGVYKIFSEAKSVGHEGSELLFNIEKTASSPNPLITATLHTDNAKALTSQIEGAGKKPFFEIFKGFQTQPELTLNFGFFYLSAADDFNVKYVLRDADMAALKEGNFNISRTELFGSPSEE